MDNNEEEKYQIHNSALSQGQNIGEHQEISQYFYIFGDISTRSDANILHSSSLNQLSQPTVMPPFPFLFLCFAPKDLPLIERLRDDLHALGMAGWAGRKAFQPGNAHEQEHLREVIRITLAVILVASPRTRRSRLVKQELDIAEMYQRPIYLFWMQGNDLLEVMPTGWSHLPSFDARAERYPQALHALLQALGKQTPLPSSGSDQKESGTNVSHYPGKYTIKNNGPIQGQVIGEHVYVNMHFVNSQKEYKPPLQDTSKKSDHTQVSHSPPSQDDLSEQPAPPLEAPRNPYKGLRAFRVEEAQDFFGRDRLVKELLEKIKHLLTISLQNQAAFRLLTVLGPSGSGKSSVVMAGLIPQLKQGVLPDSEHWIYLDPISPGKYPIEALAQTLAPLFPQRSPLNIMNEDLKDDSARGLHVLLTTYLRHSGRHVLLVIDQFEELFTQTATEEDRQHFLDLLLTAVTEPDGPLLIVVTLRADFYDRPLRYPELGQIIENHHVIAYPLETRDLRAVIEQPALLPDVQLAFEEGLIGDLLFDVRGQIGTLPLLQFTLDQLFQHRKDRLLTQQAYHHIGGVKGALAQHAERTYESLPTQVHQRLARALFLRLINPGTVEQDVTKRRILLSELVVIDQEETARLAEVAHVFTKARLLTTNVRAGVSTIEVSHEALVQAWIRLQDWLHEARDDIRLQQTISEDAAEWNRYGQPADRLYRGSQLKEALRWREANLPSLDEDRFLQASTQELERIQQEELRRRRRYTRRAVLIGLTGIVGMAGTGFLTSMLLRGGESNSDPPLIDIKLPPMVTTDPPPDIPSVAWSPDSKHIASGSADKTVQVWDANTGSRLFTYKGHIDSVNSVAWSPDGKRIASGSDDGTVQVWDASTGSHPFTYKGHTSSVYGVAWSPDDGKRIASGSFDENVLVRNAVNALTEGNGKDARSSRDENMQVWDASTGSYLFIYKVHPDPVLSVAWSPDGKRIASGSDDGTVQVWDASTGSHLFTYKGHTDLVSSVAWSPDDGKCIASGSWDRTVQVWDASTNSHLFTYKGHTYPVSSVAWSPDGKRIASGSADKTVQVWDASTGSHLFTYKGHTYPVSSVAWSPDGKHIASGSSGGVQVWDATTGSYLFTYEKHTKE